ncbi:3-hydroxyacyl-CoA dehydrogenase NAD-binding domain-containing protein [Rhizorhabdus sp.]|uniref:3-hydroxyacyl-CoA dehydrogenase NAD-binding domain-containing protein n=1 Tax=Rhizorhabdus sp. TaxID=1968843 RepID=UPI0035AECC70
MVVTQEKLDGILVLTADYPPVNALGHAVRAGLAEGIAAAAADPDVSAVVILCAGKTFFAGADIAEFGKPRLDPVLPALCDAIEASPKPVVAAIHGTALGGGLEVALAAHYRLAVRSAQFGMPEVKLGLIPGSGGTQRLPRLVGLDMALRMIVLGEQLGTAAAAEHGLIDRIVEDVDLRKAAIAFAREVVDARPLPRTGERSVAADEALVARFKAENGRKIAGQTAPDAAIEAVIGATTLSMSDGQALERRLFLALEKGEQSRALRYLFGAERQASRIDGIGDDVDARSVEHVGIIGAGTMGTGIAINFLLAGLRVSLLELDATALDRGVASIGKTLDGSVAKGRLSAEAAARAKALLSPSLRYEELAGCDLVIEAVFELMSVKKDVFGALDKVVRPDAILATNTSYLDIDEIAGSVSHPERFLGMHFFSPANIMKLLEIVRGARTAPEVLKTAMQLGRRIGKTAVVAGNCYGFIGNRMLAQRRKQAIALLMEGATPEQIDRVHTGFGMPMGPFQMSDLAGVDIGWHRDPTRIETLQDALCAAGRFGQKAGKGYYDYDADRRRSPSPEALAIIEEFARASGAERRVITDDEIRERTLYVMVNEGARIIEERIAQRASDIDVVWIHGYGWPRYRGGPMHWADQVGAATIVESLHRHGMETSPLLERLAQENGRFTS